MLLAVIAGNTNVRFGLFDAESLAWTGVESSDTLLKGGSELPADLPGPPDCVAVASVREGAFEAVAGMCRIAGLPGPLGIPADIPYPLRVAVRNPARTGADRVLDAAAALSLAGGPAAAVDCGTAVTVNAAWKGAFRGGAILPGLRTQARALNEFTSRLPLVGNPVPAAALGLDTEEAISSGIVFGIAGAVKEIIARIEAESGIRLSVFVTGGDAGVFGPLLGAGAVVRPDLALLGVRMAWEAAGRPSAAGRGPGGRGKAKRGMNGGRPPGR